MNSLPSGATPQSNLVVSSVSAPAEIDLYSMLTVSWTVSNQGTAPTSGVYWSDGVYFSRDTTIGDEDWALGGAAISLIWDADGNPTGNPYALPLDPGESYTASLTVRLRDSSIAVLDPAPLPSDESAWMVAEGAIATSSVVITVPPDPVRELAGPGYLIVKTNGGSFSPEPESDVADNTLAVPLRINGPDLSIVAATAPDTAYAGEQVDISWTVSNIGPIETKSFYSYWEDNVVVSRNEIYGDSDDIYLTGYSEIPVAVPLEPNETYTMNRLVTLPSWVSGEAYLLVKTDWRSQQAEEDETNNVFSLPIQLEATNLRPTDFNAPDVVVAKQPFSMSWSVRNVGSVTATATYLYQDVITYSRNDIYGDGDDIYITSIFNAASDGFPLAIDESYQRTASIALPRVAEGNGYLWLEANYGNVVAETDDSDDLLMLPITVRSPVNSAAASFAVSGTLAVGNTLMAEELNADPDGNGTFSHAWQTSSDRASWSTVGTNLGAYDVTAADQGKWLRLVVTYTDGLDFNERVIARAGRVPLLPALRIRGKQAGRKEGNSGSTPFTFTLRRTGDLTGFSTVPWEVFGSGASPADASDFADGQLPHGVVVFYPGQAKASVIVNVAGDGMKEPKQAFKVSLVEPILARLLPAKSSATARIRNDDRAKPADRLSASAGIVQTANVLGGDITRAADAEVELAEQSRERLFREKASGKCVGATPPVRVKDLALRKRSEGLGADILTGCPSHELADFNDNRADDQPLWQPNGLIPVPVVDVALAMPGFGMATPGESEASEKLDVTSFTCSSVSQLPQSLDWI